ncbi:MAG: FRG domain-containing protein [Cyanobacteria bacterium P01_A01_bin.68]
MVIDRYISKQLAEYSMVGESDDALLCLSDSKLLNGSLNMVMRINNHSIHSRGFKQSISPKNQILVDSYYGLAYTGLPKDSAAVYGHTEDFPIDKINELANHGYLRVPFKKIPRIKVESSEELIEKVKIIEGFFGANELLFRGQNKEYLLNRTDSFKSTFYGDTDVYEPSLLPSSVRNDIWADDYMPEWMMWVQLQQKTSIKQYEQSIPVSDEYSRQFRNSIFSEIERIWSTPKFYFYCLALAQHYGLPSNGLDLTDDFSTAMFFALNDFIKVDDTMMQVKPAKSKDSVLYLIKKEGQNEYNFLDSAPRLFQTGRPKNQGAYFFHSGWGLNMNAAANQIVAAIYFSNISFNFMPPIRHLFPNSEEDFIGRILGTKRPRLWGRWVASG